MEISVKNNSTVKKEDFLVMKYDTTNKENNVFSSPWEKEEKKLEKKWSEIIKNEEKINNDCFILLNDERELVDENNVFSSPWEKEEKKKWSEIIKNEEKIYFIFSNDEKEELVDELLEDDNANKSSNFSHPSSIDNLNQDEEDRDYDKSSSQDEEDRDYDKSSSQDEEDRDYDKSSSQDEEDRDYDKSSSQDEEDRDYDKSSSQDESINLHRKLINLHSDISSQLISIKKNLFYLENSKREKMEIFLFLIVPIFFMYFIYNIFIFVKKMIINKFFKKWNKNKDYDQNDKNINFSLKKENYGNNYYKNDQVIKFPSSENL